MQSHYGSQAPAAAGGYYAPPGSQQPPHPYAMWAGQQPMVPYGAPPGTPFYPGGIFAPPPGQPGAYPYTTPANPAASRGEDGSDADANGEVNGVKPGEGPNGAGLVDHSQMMSQHMDPQGQAPQHVHHPGVVVDPAQQYWQHQAGAMPAGQVMQVPGQHPGAEMWMQSGQDERELKRQRRKQSNRESARRSRLRKQAECEDLGKRVEKLNDENKMLRDEIIRLQQACATLTEDRSSLEDNMRGLGSNPKASGKDGKTKGKDDTDVKAEAK